MNSFSKLLLCASTALLLVACDDESDNLQVWMQQEQAATRPSVKPIAPPKEFVPQAYVAASTLDPFSKERLAAVLRGSSGAPPTISDALVAPERARRKEQLESYPLDSITMVGFLKKGAADVGLVKVDGLIYQVNKGMYLGQNYGKIKNVNESSITMREIVQDGVGEWVERDAVLELQEAKK
ncbi:type IV pilus assembly protein PilP [Comamonas odontotermitis]|uniref:Type IV pilus assembly protein PilP n=1 Tax=Comamonas odontotermitis TaxID=379895 RepID=A0ABR6RE97_9BURK|nr:pilus assembly protein PilP [Comamonas odontotermitis]MBB6577476.1 type IV pilus assembly protein PilP [Comamonas odontotermitis]